MLRSKRSLPVPLPLPAHRMPGGSGGDQPELRAVVPPAMILAPRHLPRVGGEVGAGDVMMRSDLGAAQAREERLRLVRANPDVIDPDAVVHPTNLEKAMQGVP